MYLKNEKVLMYTIQMKQAFNEDELLDMFNETQISEQDIPDTIDKECNILLEYVLKCLKTNMIYKENGIYIKSLLKIF